MLAIILFSIYIKKLENIINLLTKNKIKNKTNMLKQTNLIYFTINFQNQANLNIKTKCKFDFEKKKKK